jgi:hypothetical protein
MGSMTPYGRNAYFVILYSEYFKKLRSMVIYLLLIWRVPDFSLKFLFATFPFPAAVFNDAQQRIQVFM